jgi:hypothetical protein
MSEQPNDSMSGELKKLAENLKLTIRTAWESDERKQVTKGIEEGLTELSQSLEEVTRDIRTSETAQRIREDLQDFQNRVTTGEVETKLKSEFVASLKLVNDELEKFTDRWSSHRSGPQSTSQHGDTPQNEGIQDQ